MPRFWKPHEQASASIQFSNDEGQPGTTRHWLTTDDIDGDAVFKLPAGARVEFFRIALKGVVTTKSSTTPHGSMQPRWRTEHSKFLSLKQDIPARRDSGPGDGSVLKTPFHINLHDYQQSSMPDFDLPPSMNSAGDSQKRAHLRNHDADAVYSITYSLAVAAFSNDRVLASTSQDLHITPANEAQPPISTTDFPGEYALAARTAHSSRFAMKKTAAPRVELRGEEPEPVVLRATKGTFEGSTDVNLIVNLSRGDLQMLDDSHLPSQCHLKAHLTAKTLVTPDGTSNGVPTLDHARLASDASIRLDKSHAQEYTVAVANWIRCSLDGDNSKVHNDDFFITRLPFRFRLSGDKPPPPTFNTSLLSRRYAIDLTVTFPQSSTQSLKLSIPVQIVYESGELEKRIDN